MPGEIVPPTREEMKAIIEKYGHFVNPEFLRRRSNGKFDVFATLS